MIIVLPLLVALVGLLMYILSGNSKIQELGRLMFGAGVLAFLLVGGEQVVTLLGR